MGSDAGRVVETITSAIVNTVNKGGSVVIPGFGSLKQVSRAACTCVNPSSAKLKNAARKALKFTPDSAFKAAVNPKAACRKADKAAAGKAAAPAKKPAAQKPAAKTAVAKKSGKAC